MLGKEITCQGKRNKYQGKKQMLERKIKCQRRKSNEREKIISYDDNRMLRNSSDVREGNHILQTKAKFQGQKTNARDESQMLGTEARIQGRKQVFRQLITLLAHDLASAADVNQSREGEVASGQSEVQNGSERMAERIIIPASKHIFITR